MKFACLFFAASVAVWNAPLEVGEFRAEVRHTFGVSNGLAFRRCPLRRCSGSACMGRNSSRDCGSRGWRVARCG